MANSYKDTEYMSICSEKTLQSNEKGFFLTFAEHVSATVGEKWIDQVFSKAKNDGERIRLIYEDETAQNVVCEVLSHVQEIYRKKSSEISQARRIEAEKALENGDCVKALTLYSQSVLRAQPTDKCYRKTVVLKMFTDGWGKTSDLVRLVELRRRIINKKTGFAMVESNHPIKIIKNQEDRDGRILEGHFENPLVQHCPEIVPTPVQTAYFQMVLPLQWKSDGFKPVCIHLAGTGQNAKIDAGFSLPLALLGRSRVFLKTNEFDLALKDLQVALKENLPDDYKGEAYWKIAVCYKALGEHHKCKVSFELSKKLLRDLRKINLMEEDMKRDFLQVKRSIRKMLPKITGEAHRVFKNASKKISVERSEDKGRFVVAGENIKTGETLVVEPPYAACLLPECFGSHCHHCFERLVNPIGCPVCSNVAFCTQLCRDEALSTYHRYECKFLDLLIGSGMSILSHTALRSITQKNLSESLDIYENKSKETVYALCTLAKLRPAKDFLQRTLMAAFLLRCLQKSGFFGKDTDRVVPDESEYKIAELLLFHLQMLQFNAHEIYETRHSPEHRFRGAKAAYIGVAVYPTVALFNHDCYPAVTRYFVGKNIVINAVRPLRLGDVIAENYGPIFTRKTLSERQRSLFSRYWFECKCSACAQNWPSLDTGLESISRRLRCPTGKCSNTFNLPLQNDTLKCPKCKKVVCMKDALIELEECEEKYKRSFELLEEQKPEEASKVLCEAIDTFHSISNPPHRDTHLAQEMLRACLADSGNTYECLVRI